MCYTIGKLEDASVVGDYDECPVGAFRHASQDLHHAAPGLMVEVAGRLVADDQFRFMYQCTGNRHALLLAAAELPRKRVKTRAKIDRFERLFRASFGVPSWYAVNQQRDRHVFNGIEGGQQVEKLKNKTDRRTAKACLFLLNHALQVLAQHLTITGILLQNCGNDRDQRGLPTT